jgi:hypothetical protein
MTKSGVPKLLTTRLSLGRASCLHAGIGDQGAVLGNARVLLEANRMLVKRAWRQVAVNLHYSQPVGSEVEGFRCRVHCPGDGGGAKILMNGERRLRFATSPSSWRQATGAGDRIRASRDPSNRRPVDWGRMRRTNVGGRGNSLCKRRTCEWGCLMRRSSPSPHDADFLVNFY